VRSTVIGAHAATEFGIFYEMSLDPSWTFRSVVIQRTDGATYSLLSDGKGNWRDSAGARPDLAGCIDVDISGTPFTNTLPIRRVAMQPGVPVRLRMAWIPLDSLGPFVDEQVYTRRDDNHYHYQAADGSFEAELRVDADGLVDHYPTLFTRV
jgi:hypothetical protein